MTQPRDQEIRALKQELKLAKREIQLLQSARSFRVTSYIKRLLTSPPHEYASRLRELPSVMKKRSVTDRTDESGEKMTPFNSAFNPLPLSRFPNINVALFVDEASYIGRLFSLTTAAMEAGDPTLDRIANYDAVHLVVVDAGNFKDRYSVEDLEKYLGSSTAVVAFVQSAAEYRAMKKLLSSLDTAVQFCSLSTFFSETNPEIITIPYYIDTYSVEQQYPDNNSSTQILTNLNQLNDISHTRISILSKNLIEQIQESDDVRLHEQLLFKIASYAPVFTEDSSSAIYDLPPYDKRLAEYYQYYIERSAIESGNNVVLTHNAAQSIYPLLSHLGLPNTDRLKPKIAIIACTKRPEYVSHLIKQIERQTITPYSVLFSLHGFTERQALEATRLIRQSSLPANIQVYSSDILFGEVLNDSVARSDAELFAKFDDDDYYLPKHLEDLYAARLVSCADIVGKWNNWVYLKDEDVTINWVEENANSHVQHSPGGTSLYLGDLLRNVKFGKVRRAIDSELYRRAIPRGSKIYSTHRFNYVRTRGDDHTYKTDNTDFKARATGTPLRGLNEKELST